MILTTNSPVMDFPEAWIGEAERRRVLEILVTQALSNSDAKVLNVVAEQNYGLAADPFLRNVVRDRADIRSAFNALSDQYLMDATMPDANRFGVWLAVSALIAGKIAKKADIIAFDPEPIVDMALAALRDTSQEIRTPAELIEEALMAFLNSNLKSIAVKNGGRWSGSGDREVVAALFRESNTLAVPVHRLKSLCMENNIPGTMLREWMRPEEDNVVEKKNQRMGRGAAPEFCAIIKLPETFADIGDSNGTSE